MTVTPKSPIFPAVSPKGRVLVIGAYGLIGFGIAKHLAAQGYAVAGLGRDRDAARRAFPDMPFIVKDMRAMTDARDWEPALTGVVAVVNCSGALQDGPADDLEAVHHHAVAALATACAAVAIRVIQISAVGVELGSPNPFLASKARGDAAIRASGASYHIFRPGLVLAPNAYGGTALIRMLAAVPVIQPIAMPDARIQTVSLDDIARAVADALVEQETVSVECDLVEAQAHSLRDVVGATRRWLGFDAAKAEVRVPDWLNGIVRKGADALSPLGWRSPLRTNAMSVLTNGVTGKSDAVRCASLTETLATMPATAEDRLFARMALLMPVLVATLSLFWFASGVIGLLCRADAAAVLVDVGWPPSLAMASVVLWVVVDIAIAGALIVRKTAKLACWAMIGVSGFYLVAATVFTPHLWADPLGPLTKIAPVILAALVTRVALETR